MPNFEALNGHGSLKAINALYPVTRGAMSHFYQILHNSALLDTSGLQHAWRRSLR